jgi:hypothetical protein
VGIDLKTQKPISATEATRYFPSVRDGRPCHVSRVIRKMVKGDPLPGGGRAYLDGLKFGGQWVTTVEAIQEFGERVAAAAISGHNDSPPVRTSTARSREAARAARELDKIGI